MSENQEQQQKDHWRELADLLGLEPESDVSKESTTPTPHGARVHEARGEPPFPAQFEETPAPEDDASEETREAAEPEPSAPQDFPAVEEPRHERSRRQERPGRGDQRGGRGGRGGGRRGSRGAERRPPDASAHDAGAPESEERPLDGDNPPPERRGRRRPPDFAESPAAQHPRTRSTPDDDDDDEIISNWNVPSWEELIDSLYRPDR